MGVEQFVVFMPERVDAARLRTAFEGVLARHASLRCSFRWHDQLTQVVHDDVSLPFEQVTLSSDGGSEEVEHWLAADRRRGFSLDSAPLLRVALLTRRAEEHHLVFSFHHILLDGRSTLQVVREAFAAYDGGFDDDLPTEVVPFARHVEHLDSLEEGRSDAFFEALLEAFEGPTPLPFGARTEHASSGHRELSRIVPEERAARIAARAEELDLRSSSFFQAAWALMLGRHAEVQDVTFGGVRACRHSTVEGAESMVGVLINTLPVRARLDPEATVRDLVRDLRTQWVALREHENTPLSRIVGLVRDESADRLFDTLVMYEQYDLATELPALGGPWAPRRVRLLEHTGVPLSLSVYHQGRARLTIEYDTNCFDDAEVDALLDMLDALLAEMVEDPDRKLGTLVGLSPETRDRVLDLSAGPPLDTPVTDTVHAMLWARAGAADDAIAVSSDDAVEGLDYGTLRRRAHGFAARLCAEGVTRGQRVGLCTGRDVDFAVGLLGILEAGAAYVPLDPTYPPERLAFILEDASIALVVTTEQTRGVAESLGARALVVGDETSEESVGVEVDGEDIAYVIYTSGSTGRPKGVPIRHSSVVRHCLATSELYDLTAEDRIPQFASISFDIAVEEIFPTWSVGAELVLRPADVVDIAGFTRWLAKRGITVLQLPTAFFQQWVDALLSQGMSLPPTIRLVIVGGEAATLAAYRRFTSIAGPNTRWINAYGPTEATVTATTFEATGESLRDDPPIGKPIPGAFAYLLDQRSELVPFGVPGELYLGGKCLTPGYLNRPEQTEARFVENPIVTAGAPRRLYRTGDRARRLPTGDIAFLGRDDRQVKVRGYRIELGEVESALAVHPSVVSAAAKVWGEGANRRLVGYVSGSSVLDTGEIRCDLEGRVPSHLVPGRIVALDAMPRLPNGKVDYASLPLPADDAPKVDDDNRPRTLLEHMLLELWRETLGRRDIGIHDSFFASGGDSLAAIRLLNQANRMGLQVDGPTFFASPTVAEMAEGACVPRAMAEEDARSLVVLQPRGTRPPLYFMHSTPGDLLGYGPLIYALGVDQPCYGLQSHGLGASDEAHESIEEMARHYADLILRFQAEGPYVLVGWCFGGHVALETARALGRAGRRVAPVVLVDAFPAMGQAERALAKLRRGATLIRRGPRRWVTLGRRLLFRPQTDYDRVFEVDMDAGAFANRRHVYETNMRAMDAHRTRHYHGSALLIRCSESDDTVTERDYDWSRFIDVVEIFEVDATHETLLKEPHATEVARFLHDWIGRACELETPPQSLTARRG